MLHHIQFAHWVPFPLSRVFRFFADPHNLPRIMPLSTGTLIVELRLVSPPDHPQLAGIGSEIVTSFRIVPGLRAEWIARITEFEWEHHFADTQLKGPFKSFHHRHEFSAEERGGIVGTTVRDTVSYEPGYGLLGEIADRIFIRRQLQRTFAFRQRVLETILP